MSVIKQAKAALEGVTNGPWIVEWPDDNSRGEFAVWHDDGCPGQMFIASEISQGYDDGQADAHFIAAARTLMPALIAELESWQDVATARWDLIEQLKAEKRQLAHEVRRLKGELGYCNGCGGAFPAEHDCGRKKK